MKMKTVLLASLTTIALSIAAIAAPASAADFTGPRVGATIGFADDDFAGTEAFTYGLNVGYDFDLGGLVAGGTFEYQDSEEDGFGRDLSIVARLGGKAADNVLLYGLAGYTNLSAEGTSIELDGYRIGAGVEVALTDNVYTGVEYRYSNYELDLDAHQMALSLGYRF
jgi:outer membrane immunogenic protein